jgi:hypothetical protein
MVFVNLYLTDPITDDMTDPPIGLPSSIFIQKTSDVLIDYLTNHSIDFLIEYLIYAVNVYLTIYSSDSTIFYVIHKNHRCGVSLYLGVKNFPNKYP